jgi:hypothetical protein
MSNIIQVGTSLVDIQKTASGVVGVGTRLIEFQASGDNTAENKRRSAAGIYTVPDGVAAKFDRRTAAGIYGGWESATPEAGAFLLFLMQHSNHFNGGALNGPTN